MSRLFCWFLVALSLVMLLLNVANLDRAKPPVMLFWVLVAGLAAFKLCGRKAPESN